jgi:hypothetical protein
MTFRDEGLGFDENIVFMLHPLSDKRKISNTSIFLSLTHFLRCLAPFGEAIW